MLKITKFLLIFTVFFWGGQYLLVLILNHVKINSEFRYSRMFFDQIDSDILILGNSRGVHSFYSPMTDSLYRISSFNLSYNGMDRELFIPILNDYISNQSNTKIVLLELSAFLNIGDIEQKNSVINQFNLYWKNSKAIKTLINDKFPDNNIFNNIFPLYQYNNELFMRCLAFFNKSDQRQEVTKSISTTMLNKTLELDNIDISIDISALSKLKFWEDHCARKKNIKVVYFYAPYLPVYHDKMKNWELVIKSTEKVLQKPVIDLTSAIQSENMFADRLHLNKLGKVQTTRFLVDSIYSSR
ncbi:MAG: hypothetical protein JXR07_08355 [Reichenbachiella sp.]